MDIEKTYNIYFIGIGGIGMSALARYFKHLGKNVAGYDRTHTKLTETLENEEINIHYSDNTALISNEFKTDKKNVLVIYTPAVSKKNTELNYFINNKFEVVKRSEVLGSIIHGKNGIAVAGTHGKTTVSSMIAHIFNNSKLGCNAFLGGIASNYNTNFITNNKSNYVVVEADEFDRSFLQLSPEFVVITSIDADHLDIYGTRKELVKSFNSFASQISPNGKLLINKKVSGEINVRSDILKYTYSINEKSDFYIREYKISEGHYVVTLASPFGIIKDIQIGIPGILNIENAVAAMAVAILEGIESNSIKAAMAGYKGVNRRFEYIIRTNNLVFIDDYAHHPVELEACISSVRELYREKKITGIFQPHLYSRTNDFADDFAKSLSLLDELILLDIYPAREQPVKGVSSKLIFDKVSVKSKILTTKEEFWKIFPKQNYEVLLTLGAGDIDKMVIPIKEQLLDKIK
ncbi:MAG: UDP-N-acetylmuramate--L-alanine ligase [Chlorobi bacterium]|nr:UDP-N-acetylmuramate--L-alanine ligase [Chlorobiota bacterium]